MTVHDRRGRRWAAGAGLGVLLIGLGVFLLRAGLEDADRWASVFGVFLNIAGLAVTVYSAVWARRAAARPKPDPDGRVTNRIHGGQFLLGAFVRNHATWPVGSPDGPQHPTATVDANLPWLRVRAPDIQAAMGALGRRTQAANPQALYLSRVDLRSVALRGARLNRATFRYSNLARAVLVGVQLDDSDLTAADLRYANLEHARLTRANLSRAYLQGANLRGADLRDVDLHGADLSEAILDDAELTGARADTSTKWPAGLTAQRRQELGVKER